jgi:hypothetical protein
MGTVKLRVAFAIACDQLSNVAWSTSILIVEIGILHREIG